MAYYLIGIDPGAHGAMAAIDLYNFTDVRAWNMSKYSLSQMASIFQDLRGGGGHENSMEAVLEEPLLPVHNTQKDTNFNLQAHQGLSRSIGQWEGVLAACNVHVQLVRPVTWQSYMKCKTGGDKSVLTMLAKMIFGERLREGVAVTNDNADALLLALYRYVQLAEVIPARVTAYLAHLKEERNRKNHKLSQMPLDLQEIARNNDDASLKNEQLARAVKEASIRIRGERIRYEQRRHGTNDQPNGQRS